MSDQPNPTGEWTPALLSRIFDSECSPEEAIERICALHNAALAASRAGGWLSQEALYEYAKVEQEHQQLLEKLAAEIKASSLLSIQLMDYHGKHAEAVEALEAARSDVGTSNDPLSTVSKINTTLFKIGGK